MMILGSIGIKKSMRTPLTLFAIPTMLSWYFGELNGGLVPWDNLSNPLKS